MDDFDSAIAASDLLDINIAHQDNLFTNDNNSSSLRSENIKHNIKPLYLADEDENLASLRVISDYSTVASMRLYNESKINDVVDLTDAAYDIEEDDSDDCIIIDSADEAIDNIPSLSDKSLDVQNRINRSSIIQYESDTQYTPNTVVYTNLNTSNNHIGNLVPQQYTNVNMQQSLPNNVETFCPVNQTNIVQVSPNFVDYAFEDPNFSYDNYSINTSIIGQSNMIDSNNLDLYSLPAQSFVNCNLSMPMPIQEMRPCVDNTNPVQTHHISNRNDSVSYNYEKHTKFLQEMKRKRKRDIQLRKLKENESENSENAVKTDEVLIGLTWRDGPAAYWYTMYNVPVDVNILNHRIKPTLESDDGPIVPVIKAESLGDSDCQLSTWQLIPWEDDIIMDIETSHDAIIGSNKKYACHAGWIPSSKHRNMSSFQDATCSDYFGIWPSSSTGTTVTNPNVSNWHSIFSIENAQIISNDWLSQIILDIRNPNAQIPYLLELDLNNECIHFDFTNQIQTKEILNSELNNVYLTSSNTQQTVQDDPVTEPIDEALITPSNVDSEYQESHLKKIKILSKITEVTKIEDHPKEQPQEPVECEAICLLRYSDRDPYTVARDHVTKFSFTIDPNDSTDTSDIANPLIQHGIQHSHPATQLDPLYFPLTLDNQFLRHMHRTRLIDVMRPMNGLFESPQSIFNLIDVVKTESEQRFKICQLTGSGDLFFMRTITDLTATTDHLVLAEYSEEYPPLMMQTGMATRIINYFKGHYNQPVIMPQLPYGELSVVPRIPFLGQISSNQIFQTLENNMFRAPIYSHKLKPTDFLVIIKPSAICIRRVTDIFVVGQELPLMEVPAPNSKKANSFLKDFLQVQIIRLFIQSPDNPKRVKHDDLKAMFTGQSDSVLKKRLKIFAEYKKAEIGSKISYWVLKPEFKLPSEDELLELITPEDCCAYYSMAWGLCRLEDAGYNSKSFIQADPDRQDDDEDGKESHLKIEDEVKAAPWHTTRTFIEAQNNKCYLELFGSTEPTGCGESFSYAKVSAIASLFRETLQLRPTSLFEKNKNNHKNKRVMGTDADLRKLTNKKACALLKEFGISHRDFKKLKRWDILDLVKQLSTQKANRGEEKSVTKFARSTKMTLAGQEEKYKKECQRIFNLQNQVLNNDEDLTTDEGESNSEAEDEENCDDLSKSIQGVLGKRLGMRDTDIESDLFKAKPTSNFILGKLSSTENNGKKFCCPATADNARDILKNKAPVPKAVPKALCIRRQVQNKDGTKAILSQTIPWSTIVKIYFKMNQEHKSEYLRTFCGLNKADDEKKARKKQQEKIKLLKQQKNHNIHYLGHSSVTDSINKIMKMSKYRPKMLNGKIQTSEALASIICGACGTRGHMRTNKVCPLYMNSIKKAINKRPINWDKESNKFDILKMRNPIIPYPAAVPQTLPSQHAQTPTSFPDLPVLQCPKSDNIISDNFSRLVDSVISEKCIPNNANNYQISGSLTDQIKERQLSEDILIPIIPINDHVIIIPDDNPETYNETTITHKDTITTINSTSENKVDTISDQQMTVPKPYITQQSAPSNVSMLCQDSQNNIRDNNDIAPSSIVRYNSYTDCNNSTTSTNAGSSFVPVSKKKETIRGNKRRVNPRVALNHQFEEIYKGLLQIPGNRCFMYPVRKKEFPTYHSIIEKPMDLSKIRMKINKNTYETREDFLKDIKLIYDNCIKFNGDSNTLTTTARYMMSYVMEQFCVKERKLMRLEKMANPLMDDDDMVGLKYLLDKSVSAMEEVEHSRIFQAPVNRKIYPDYFTKVKNPMDLQTIRANVHADKYKSREDFLVDVNQILVNSVIYNGDDVPVTNACRKVIQAAHNFFAEREATFLTLEMNLRMQSDDASGSHVAPSSCMTADHLSHIGEDHNDENILDAELPLVKRLRLSESCEDEKNMTASTTPAVRLNKEKVMVDLELTDSENEDIIDTKDLPSVKRSHLEDDTNTEIQEIKASVDSNINKCVPYLELSDTMDIDGIVLPVNVNELSCEKQNNIETEKCTTTLLNVECKKYNNVINLELSDSDEDCGEINERLVKNIEEREGLIVDSSNKKSTIDLELSDSQNDDDHINYQEDVLPISTVMERETVGELSDVIEVGTNVHSHEDQTQVVNNNNQITESIDSNNGTARSADCDNCYQETMVTGITSQVDQIFAVIENVHSGQVLDQNKCFVKLHRLDRGTFNAHIEKETLIDLEPSDGEGNNLNKDEEMSKENSIIGFDNIKENARDNQFEIVKEQQTIATMSTYEGNTDNVDTNEESSTSQISVNNESNINDNNSDYEHVVKNADLSITDNNNTNDYIEERLLEVSVDRVLQNNVENTELIMTQIPEERCAVKQNLDLSLDTVAIVPNDSKVSHSKFGPSEENNFEITAYKGSSCKSGRNSDNIEGHDADGIVTSCKRKIIDEVLKNAFVDTNASIKMPDLSNNLFSRIISGQISVFDINGPCYKRQRLEESCKENDDVISQQIPDTSVTDGIHSCDRLVNSNIETKSNFSPKAPIDTDTPLVTKESSILDENDLEDSGWEFYIPANKKPKLIETCTDKSTSEASNKEQITIDLRLSDSDEELLPVFRDLEEQISSANESREDMMDQNVSENLYSRQHNIQNTSNDFVNAHQTRVYNDSHFENDIMKRKFSHSSDDSKEETTWLAPFVELNKGEVTIDLRLTDSEDDCYDNEKVVVNPELRVELNSHNSSDMSISDEVDDSSWDVYVPPTNVPIEVDSIKRENFKTLLFNYLVDTNKPITIDLRMSDSEDEDNGNVSQTYVPMHDIDLTQSYINVTHPPVNSDAQQIDDNQKDVMSDTLLRSCIYDNQIYQKKSVAFDLQMPDGEDDVDHRRELSKLNPQYVVGDGCINNEFNVSQSTVYGGQENIIDNVTALEEKSNNYYYQNYDNKSKLENSSTNVVFYISDDD